MPARPRALTPDKSARHLFGAKLRAARERAVEHLSLGALGDIVNLSTSHLSRIENADVMPPPDLPEKLDAAFGTDGIFTELYALCAREIHPDQFRRRMELEARARHIREYSGQLVPGLLQTEAYAKAQFRGGRPRSTDAEIEELLTARMARQALMHREDAPEHSFILDEGVLLRSFGGPGVMREQLARLADATCTPHGVIQVLPFAFGGHALMGGLLSILTLPDGAIVAYEESIATGTLLEETHLVVDRQRAYDRLTAHAWSPEQTAAHIRSLMEALPT